MENMKETSIENIISLLPQLNESRGYWFVRTNGGLYYDNFIEEGFIAIGYDEITLESIKMAHENKASGLLELGNIVRDTYKKDEYRPNFVASQLVKFSYEIKKGDIVLIPSENSSRITFGEVSESAVFLQQRLSFMPDVCPFVKRKKVDWIETKSRDSLDPYLYKMFFSHQAISDASQYGPYIDKAINSIFIKGDKAHLVLDVQTSDNIKARDLFEYGTVTLELFDEFCKEENLPYNSDQFDVKINVQSPGLIELAGLSIDGIVYIGIILVAVTGGGFSLKTNAIDVSLKTDGIISKIQAFLKSRSNIKTKRKLIEKHTEQLQIKNPEELVRVLDELNKD
ncbi:MAG: hypothetical protein Q8J88_01220 [Bacteroidales bacterium]|nr:hypothetical protein [Bacteroidales bacterium]